MTFSLNGSSVINDNRGRISVYDLEVVGENDFSSALKCISERTVSATPQLGTGVGSFYLDGDSPFCCDGGPNGIDRFGGITFGWSGNSADEDDRRVYSLRRRTPNPDEGYFTCIINIDNRQERGLYILYPSEFSIICSYSDRFSVGGCHKVSSTHCTKEIQWRKS